MKIINCTKCNEEYAIDLNKPEEWYCPYCDNLYSFTAARLSVKKLQEQLNTAKKALTEIFGIAASHDDNPVMPFITDISNATLEELEWGEDESQ